MPGAGFLDEIELPQTCRTRIYRKHVVSDNRRSYENRSYLRCLLIDFDAVYCPVTGRWSSVEFQDGGPKVRFARARAFPEAAIMVCPPGHAFL